MAREMALAGVDRSELTPPEPPKAPQGIRAKWQNLWYHYKWLILFVGFLLILGLLFTYQTLTRDPADYEVIAVTEYAILPPEQEALEAYMASCAQDVDGDGKIEIDIVNLTPSYSTDVAPGIGHSDAQKLISSLSTGENMLYVFDDVSLQGFLDTVSEVTTDDYWFFAPLDTTSASYDEEICCFDWADDARRDQPALQTMPDHLLFGVRTPEGTASGAASVAMYTHGKALIEKLADTALL